MLTATERKKLAREARKLAMECLTNGPDMENTWCGCAIGICMKRAGLWPGDNWDESAMLTAAGIDALASGGRRNVTRGGMVSEATRERVRFYNPTAVVFPLLAMADALDETP